MSVMENPSHDGKWYCNRCHTWCTDQVPRCSWCSSPRPVQRPIQRPVEPESPKE